MLPSPFRLKRGHAESEKPESDLHSHSIESSVDEEHPNLPTETKFWSSKAAGRWITEDLCLLGVFRRSIEMSEQFFYVEFVFTPKRGCRIDHHRVVVEIPKCLVVKQLAASADGKSEERLIIRSQQTALPGLLSGMLREWKKQSSSIMKMRFGTRKDCPS